MERLGISSRHCDEGGDEFDPEERKIYGPWSRAEVTQHTPARLAFFSGEILEKEVEEASPRDARNANCVLTAC